MTFCEINETLVTLIREKLSNFQNLLQKGCKTISIQMYKQEQTSNLAHPPKKTRYVAFD